MAFLCRKLHWGGTFSTISSLLAAEGRTRRRKLDDGCGRSWTDGADDSGPDF